MANNEKRRAGSSAKYEKGKQLCKVENRRNDASGMNTCSFHRSPAFTLPIRGSYDRENIELMIQILPLDCIQDILTSAPLSKVFRVLCRLGMLSENVWTSPQFQNEWDKCNREMCLVVNHSDAISMMKLSDGICSEDILHEWINNSTWSLRAAAGGFLVFINEQEGKLQAVNLLTMKVHQIPDMVVNSRYRLSFYIKKYPKEVVVELREVLRTNSCELILMGNFTYKKLHLLIYSLTSKSWERKVPQNSASLKKFSKTLVRDGKVYCFSEDFRSWVCYSIHEGERLCYVRPSIQRRNGDALNKALVVCKGRIMKFELQSFNQYAIYVLDETSYIPRWSWGYTSNLSAIPFRLSHNFLVTSGGGNNEDYIWVLSEGKDKMMSIDFDAHRSRLWKCPPMNNLTSENSKLFCMPLMFSPYI